MNDNYPRWVFLMEGVLESYTSTTSRTCPSDFGFVFHAADREDLYRQQAVVRRFDVGVLGLAETVEVEFVQVESGRRLPDLQFVLRGPDAVVLLQCQGVVLAVNAVHFAGGPDSVFIDVDYEIGEFEQFLHGEVVMHHQQAEHSARFAVELQHPLFLVAVGVVFEDAEVVLEVQPHEQLHVDLRGQGLSGQRALAEGFKLAAEFPLASFLENALLAIILAFDLLFYFVVSLQGSQQGEERLLAAQLEPLIGLEPLGLHPHHLHEGFLRGEGLGVHAVVSAEAGVEVAGDVLLEGVGGNAFVEGFDFLDYLVDVAGEGRGQEDAVLDHAQIDLVLQTPPDVDGFGRAAGRGWRCAHAAIGNQTK